MSAPQRDKLKNDPRINCLSLKIWDVNKPFLNLFEFNERKKMQNKYLKKKTTACKLTRIASPTCHSNNSYNADRSKS